MTIRSLTEDLGISLHGRDQLVAALITQLTSYRGFV